MLRRIKWIIYVSGAGFVVLAGFGVADIYGILTLGISVAWWKVIAIVFIGVMFCVALWRIDARFESLSQPKELQEIIRRLGVIDDAIEALQSELEAPAESEDDLIDDAPEPPIDPEAWIRVLQGEPTKERRFLPTTRHPFDLIEMVQGSSLTKYQKDLEVAELKGQWYKLSGRVKTHYPLHPGGPFRVLMDIPPGMLDSDVVADFLPEFSSHIKALNVGDPITLIGCITNIDDLDGLELGMCEIR